MVAREDMKDAKSQPPKYERCHGNLGRYGDAKSLLPNKYERRQVAREDMEDAKYQPQNKYERRHGSQGRYGGCQVFTAR